MLTKCSTTFKEEKNDPSEKLALSTTIYAWPYGKFHRTSNCSRVIITSNAANTNSVEGSLFKDLTVNWCLIAVDNES